ncbi:polyketide synthase [Nocardia fluminea]|uniref:beta-ketoacyl [acyl carrier protein] synthase domain-containing protein n=1 Tax=Nocardia fluminea TaxID=134984 RepID=UPI0037FDDDBD
MPNEPIAIVGMAALYPQAHDIEEFWKLITLPAVAAAATGLDELDIDVTAFRIPPVQNGSMARLQVLMLEASRQCLADAGHPDRALPNERTDVVVGTCFGLDRQYANALRIDLARYARELERAASIDDDYYVRSIASEISREMYAGLSHRLGASRHDRVGEMASTIPARIATTFHLFGRTIALESADSTSFVALDTAMASLRAGVSDAVLVVTGQRREGSLIEEALAAKGITASDGEPFTLSDGVGALLLKRHSTAVADGDRIYAAILECAVRHDPHGGARRDRTTANERHLLERECHLSCGVDPAAVRYVESVELGSVAAVGSVADRIGHTFANAGVAGLTKAALALHHRMLPPRFADGSANAPLPAAPANENWPADPKSGSRYAAVCGAGLGGTLSYLLLEGHRAIRPASAPVSVASPEPIAIVGFGGTFAGSIDAEEFWDNSRFGRSGIGVVPEVVFDRDLYFAPGEITLTHSYSEIGASLAVPDEPPFARRIASPGPESMDPAQRIALSVADEALSRYRQLPTLRERAGVVAIGTTLCLATERRLGGEREFVELETAFAQADALAQLPPDDRARILERARRGYGRPGMPLVPTDLDGWLASGVAGVIAREYRLRTVPVAVEAACASALAALDLAISALRLGKVDFALAGGVELACTARDLVLCSALGLLSPTRITPFDSEADGFNLGDGCSLFLLKRLSDAQRDGDEIYGLIRGVGASNDAKSLIAPDADGQIRAMRAAFAQVDFGPAAVDYLEAHGTGTQVGDRVEISAVADVYATPGRSHPLVVGSVKALIGHTFAAAGAAGLLHALQAIRARTYPYNAHLTTINPDLPLLDIPAILPTESIPWPAAPGRPRRAAVSSFGTGGINYHLLLEEYRQD